MPLCPASFRMMKPTPVAAAWLVVQYLDWLGRIVLKAGRNDMGRTEIRIADNGPGLDDEQIDNIFVPFFTTKQRGTGVGLSVSRQLMRLNHGQITVKSEPGKGTEFALQFRS